MEQENEKKASGFDQVKRIYNTLDLNSKIIISGALVLIVVALLLVVSVAFRPDYVLLYGGLDLKDSSEIIQELDSQNVKYKVRAGGKDILVPLTDRDRMRIAIAGKGFLPSTTTGYELFDKNRMTLSTFQQKVDHQRALEGELARTLMSLEEVEFARVHLVMPDPSPFLEDEEDATASVVLKLKGAARLHPDKMSAIANLVATAVPGMDPSKITIMDDRANILSGGTDSENALNLAPNQINYRKQVEDSLKLKIKSVLEPAYGIGNISVAVSSDMDFDKKAEQKKTFEPYAGGSTGIVRSQETTEKTSQNTPTSESGVAGASANLPSYQGASTESGQSSKTEETTETKNYEINETSTTTEYAQGNIKKLSVSVLINAEKLDAQEKTDVENLVRSSINYDQERGDSITVAAQVFDTTFQEEIDAARAKTQAAAAKQNYLTIGLLLLTGALLAFALFKMMKPVKLPTPGLAYAGSQPQSETEAVPDFRAMEGLDTAQSKLRDEVMKVARQNPEGAAKVIKTWLKE